MPLPVAVPRLAGVKIVLGIQQVPPDHQGGYDLAREEIEVEGSTYHEAVEAAKRQMPEGWRSVYIRTERTDG